MRERRYLQLGVLSFVILFLEMSLIRWVSTEIRIFAYVNNLVLLACFLGMGVGCYCADLPFPSFLTLLTPLILILVVANPSIKEAPTLLSVFSDTVIWFARQPYRVIQQLLLGLTATLIVFALTALAFFPLGQMLGTLFKHIRNTILAYSLNIAASLAGIWCYNLQSFTSLPPWVWFIITIECLLFVVGWTRAHLRIVVGFLAILFVLAVYPVVNRQFVLWSPYQKLEVAPIRRQSLTPEYFLTVNNVNYMLLLDLSDATVKQLPRLFDYRAKSLGPYEILYRFKPEAQDVLIVGAGAGNDAAGALRHGIRHITTVEIDPGIYRVGRLLHPEAPYANGRVEMVVDDARAFFRRCTERYDLISFGLLDSHTLGSSLTNTRIDHYVYTLESFQEAKALLRPGGVLTVLFETPRPWVRERIRGLLQTVFGAEPVVFENRNRGQFGWGGERFVISDDMARLRTVIAHDDVLRTFIAVNPVDRTPPVKLTTDNWPYLYLESPRIPLLHLCLSGILLLMLIIVGRRLLPAPRRNDWHFFFLGAAFLLLEFQNISKAALLFGSTWLVSALMISAILALVLAANALASVWKPMKVGLIYGGLLLSIGVLFLTPLRSFNALPYASRILTAGVLLNLPIFFGGLIFIHSFKRTPHIHRALGANLLGACVGGLLESLSFVVGVHLTLLLVGVFYLVSLACLNSRPRIFPYP